jgi:nucleoid DNA-binding protein
VKTDKKILSKLKQIEDRVSKDLNVDKQLVRKVVLETFKEIGLILLLKNSPVMIRGFLKIVVAVRAARKALINYNKLESREK